MYIKYIKGKKGFSTKDRIKMYRLIENMAVGAGLPEAMQGAGSPTAMKIMIGRQANIDRKKELAKVISGIGEDPYFQDITEVKEDKAKVKAKGKNSRK